MSLDLTDDKSTLVQVMAWCHQATSHYLSQCWPRSLSPYGITRLEFKHFHSRIYIYKIVICKRVAILFKPQCIDSQLTTEIFSTFIEPAARQYFQLSGYGDYTRISHTRALHKSNGRRLRLDTMLLDDGAVKCYWNKNKVPVDSGCWLEFIAIVLTKNSRVYSVYLL